MPRCDGLGQITFFDPKRVVAFPHLSLAGGRSRAGTGATSSNFSMLQSLAQHYGFDVVGRSSCCRRARRTSCCTARGGEIAFRYPRREGRMRGEGHAFEGILSNLERPPPRDRFRRRQESSPSTEQRDCPECHGTRLRREGATSSSRAATSRLGCPEASSRLPSMRCPGDRRSA